MEMFAGLQARLSPHAAAAASSSLMWKQAFAEEERVRKGDVHAERVVVAWRLVRELAAGAGVLSTGQPLSAAMGQPWLPESLWYSSTKPYMPEDGTSMVPRSAMALDHKGSLRLYPPIRQDNLVTNSTGARQEIEVCCRTMAIAAMSLGMLNYPESRMGLAGLLEPETIEDIFPEPAEIVLAEEWLAEQALESIARLGVLDALSYLADTYRFRHREVVHLVSLAKARMAEYAALSPEEAQGVMSLRVDRFIAKAVEQCDTAAMAQGLRLQSQILGAIKPRGSSRSADRRAIVELIASSQNKDADPSSPSGPSGPTQTIVVDPPSSTQASSSHNGAGPRGREDQESDP